MKNTTSRRSQTQTGSRTFNAAASHEACGNELIPWHFLSELGRQQLAMATQSANAIYRGHETLRKIQQETAHETSVRHAQAAQKLLSPRQPAELMSIQSKLLRTDMQSAGHYWKQLVAATMETQQEIMTSMSHLIGSEAGSSIKSAMQTFEASMPAMAMANHFFVPGQTTQRRETLRSSKTAY